MLEENKREENKREDYFVFKDLYKKHYMDKYMVEADLTHYQRSKLKAKEMGMEIIEINGGKNREIHSYNGKGKEEKKLTQNQIRNHFNRHLEK